MKVLIADDNFDYCNTIADIVRSYGFDAYTIQAPSEVISFLEKQNSKINIILLDIEFGPEVALNGIDLLEHCRRNYPAIPVIMISGKGTIDMAVQATKLGAINFVEKNVLSREKLREVLESAMERLGVQGEAREICRFLESQGLVGKSKPMVEMGDSIIRFGRTDLNVMVTGETGTGKKLVAKALHNVSRRAKYPIITVDIPNIPRELFQSELFGHNKGSFSGASETKKGLFHQANKGTLFLDEIGDLSLELQSSLFIPIEEKIIRRVGSTESEDLNVRFISATDKDLLYAMKEAKFREQLYHRLRECEIHIPPLRERLEDIPDIVDYYLHKHNHDYNDSKNFSPSSIEYLQEQSWGGNIRELYSLVRVALQTASSDQIEVSDLHRITTTAGGGKPVSTPNVSEMLITTGRTLKEDLAEVDKKKIETTLERTYGNVSKAAAMLDISRETLHNKIRRYGINTQMFRMKRNEKND